MNTPQGQCGSSWFEFNLACVLIGVFAAILLSALFQAEQVAERTMFDTTARNIRSGLRLRVAGLMTGNRMHEIGGLAGSNPVLLLGAPPAAYLGEIDAGKKTGDAGTWYFDNERRELVYRFHREGLSPFGSRNLREGRVSIKPIRRLSEKSRHPAVSGGVEVAINVIP